MGKALRAARRRRMTSRPGELRQTEIDDRDVEGILHPREEPLLAVLRDIDGEACLRETRLERLTQ